MQGLLALARKPVAQLLMLVMAVVIFLAASDYVNARERRANLLESSLSELERDVRELKQLNILTADLEKKMTSSGDILKSVQELAAAKGLSLASTQDAGEVELDDNFKEVRSRFRLEAVPWEPVVQMLSNIETQNSGALIRELVIRRSLKGEGVLDVEIIVARVETRES
ncbi:MAG: hypothetical protein JKX97_04395 [Candidatus Lindowbacteria bacterium]|nr:hypothetical protein [Candidatus Lindowbacteria bacterium]